MDKILKKVIKHELSEYDKESPNTTTLPKNYKQIIFDTILYALVLCCAVLGINNTFSILFWFAIIIRFACIGKTIIRKILWGILGFVLFTIAIAPSGIFARIIMTLIIFAPFYIYSLIKSSRINVISKAAAASPDTPISKIIKEEEKSKVTLNLKFNPLKIACPIIIVLGIIIPLFYETSRETYVEYRFNADTNSYTLMRYRENIFDENMSFDVPEEYNGYPVTAIDGGAFDSCNSLVSVTIPDSVTYIGGEAFAWCENLKSVTLPDNIEHIKGDTFNGCESLTKIKLPRYLKEIHENAFYGCESLENLEFPEGLVRIGAHAFHDCDSLVAIIMPDSLEEIGSSAFRECDSLVSVSVNQETFINERAFKECPKFVGTNIRHDNHLSHERIIDEYGDEFDRIEKELSSIDEQEKIHPVYVACNMVDGIKIPDINTYENCVFVKFLDSDEYTPDPSDYTIITTKKEMLSLLRKARFMGATHVKLMLSMKNGPKEWVKYLEINETIYRYATDISIYDQLRQLYEEETNNK